MSERTIAGDDKPAVYEPWEMPRYLRRIGHDVCDQAADEIERLRTSLRLLRAAFSNENGLNSLSIVDTVWVSEIETALDCIDAALKEPPNA